MVEPLNEKYYILWAVIYEGHATLYDSEMEAQDYITHLCLNRHFDPSELTIIRGNQLVATLSGYVHLSVRKNVL